MVTFYIHYGIRHIYHNISLVYWTAPNIGNILVYYPDKDPTILAGSSQDRGF